jgi:hypothetical protein
MRSASACAPPGSLHARGVEALVTEYAAAVQIGEGHDRELAAPDTEDVCAGFLDDADRLMSHAAVAALTVDLQVVVAPQIAAADAGAGNPDDRVSRVLNGCVGDL